MSLQWISDITIYMLFYGDMISQGCYAGACWGEQVGGLPHPFFYSGQEAIALRRSDCVRRFKTSGGTLAWHHIEEYVVVLCFHVKALCFFVRGEDCIGRTCR